MIMCASASAVAAPPMSFFILSMAASGLMSRPPVSKQTPLPTSVTAAVCLTPLQIDQPRRLSGRAPNRVNERKVFGQQIIADDRGDVGAVAAAQRSRRLLKVSRTHVVRRRVDQIARQRHRFDDVLKLVAIDTLRQIELCLRPLGFAITGETIRAESKCERGQPRIVGFVGKAVDAAG